MVVVFALATATTAAAQTSDPSPGSPAGAIYKLPVDSGRQDAAPHGGANGSGGGGSGSDASGTGSGAAASSYRSENNFGTSSNVPGDPNASGGGNGGGAAGPAAGAGALAVSGVATDNGDTSEPLGIALLIVMIGVGALLGLAVARARRGASR